MVLVAPKLSMTLTLKVSLTVLPVAPTAEEDTSELRHMQRRF